MTRRSFMASCTTTATGLALLGAAPANKESRIPEGRPFSKLKLKMAVSPGWFEGSLDEQLEQIAAWGFPAYEILGPQGDLAALRRKADSLGLEMTCIVGAGAIAARQMVDPTDHDRLVEMFKERIGMAKQLGCTRLVGLSGNTSIEATHDQQMKYVIQCLRRLAPIAEENGVTLVMEALNPLVDHEGYFLTRTDQTMLILEAVNSPNVKMLFDIYHQQITEGNVIRNITQNIARIGHFHVGDNPGRKQPGTGELNYKNIFKAIADSGYDGYVALECGKTKPTNEALNDLLECFDWA